MNDSSPQHSSASVLANGSPAVGLPSMDVNSIMAPGGAASRNSAPLSPLIWLAARPAGFTPFTVLGAPRREGPSTSSLPQWSVLSSAGHLLPGMRHSDQSSTPTPLRSMSLNGNVRDPAAKAASRSSSEPLSVLPMSECVSFMAGFHDFALRLPGYRNDDRSSMESAVISPPTGHQAGSSVDADSGVIRPFEQAHTSGAPRSMPPLPPKLVFHKGRSAPFPLAALTDTSHLGGSRPVTSCETTGASGPMQDSCEVVQAFPNEKADLGHSEMSSERKCESDSTSATPQTGKHTAWHANWCGADTNTSPKSLPEVRLVFRRYLDEVRQKVLDATSSEVDRAAALDALLTRSHELFDLLTNVYGVMQRQGLCGDGTVLAMARVLPFNVVPASRSSEGDEDADDTNMVSSSSSLDCSWSSESTESSSGDGSPIPRGKFRSLDSQPNDSKSPAFGEGRTPEQLPEAFRRSCRESFNDSSCCSSSTFMEVINNYSVVRVLGTGATGRVFLVIERDSRQTFALKTVARCSRMAPVRRFPLVSMSASSSVAMRQESFSMERLHSMEGTATVHHPMTIPIWPAMLALPSSRGPLPLANPRDCMDMSLSDAALDSLAHMPMTSRPSDVAAAAVVAGEICASTQVPSSASRTDESQEREAKQPMSLARSQKSLCSPVRATLGKGSYTAIVREQLPVDEAASHHTTPTNSSSANPLTPVEREIRVMRRVRNHDNVVQLREVIDDEDEDLVHLVMTYAEKGPITVMHGYDTALGCAPCDVVRPLSRCARLLHQLAEALIYVHRQRIVHNDVKPANILLTEADTVMLTDFGESILIPKKLLRCASRGVSRALRRQASHTQMAVPHNRWKSGHAVGESWVTVSGLDRSGTSGNPVGGNAGASQTTAEASFLPESSMFLTDGVDVEGKLSGDRFAIGTPAFAAPELISESMCSFDSDVWSFGVVVYSVIFGRLPFAAANISDTFDEILNAPLSFPPLSDVPQREGMTEEMYEQWVELCSRLLVREPERRLPLTRLLEHPLLGSVPASSDAEIGVVVNPASDRFKRQPSLDGHCASLLSVNSQPQRARSLVTPHAPGHRSGLGMHSNGLHVKLAEEHSGHCEFSSAYSSVTGCSFANTNEVDLHHQQRASDRSGRPAKVTGRADYADSPTSLLSAQGSGHGLGSGVVQERESRSVLGHPPLSAGHRDQKSAPQSPAAGVSPTFYGLLSAHKTPLPKCGQSTRPRESTLVYRQTLRTHESREGRELFDSATFFPVSAGAKESESLCSTKNDEPIISPATSDAYPMGSFADVSAMMSTLIPVPAPPATPLKVGVGRMRRGSDLWRRDISRSREDTQRPRSSAVSAQNSSEDGKSEGNRNGAVESNRDFLEEAPPGPAGDAEAVKGGSGTNLPSPFIAGRAYSGSPGALTPPAAPSMMEQNGPTDQAKHRNARRQRVKFLPGTPMVHVPITHSDAAGSSGDSIPAHGTAVVDGSKPHQPTHQALSPSSEDMGTNDSSDSGPLSFFNSPALSSVVPAPPIKTGAQFRHRP